MYVLTGVVDVLTYMLISSEKQMSELPVSVFPDSFMFLTLLSLCTTMIKLAQKLSVRLGKLNKPFLSVFNNLLLVLGFSESRGKF